MILHSDSNISDISFICAGVPQEDAVAKFYKTLNQPTIVHIIIADYADGKSFLTLNLLCVVCCQICLENNWNMNAPNQKTNNIVYLPRRVIDLYTFIIFIYCI